jgi:hypothetical protein
MNRNGTREMVLVIAVSLVLFLGCITSAQFLTPRNCNLFDNSQRYLQCDNININCDMCVDDRMVSVAQLTFFLGFGFLLIPVFIFGMKKLRNRSDDNVQLFD